MAPRTTVARCAIVRGELRLPNTINLSLFPTLDAFAKAVYYQLFLLSHGFSRDTCLVGLTKLAKSVLMSQRRVQSTITYLEKRGLIKRIDSRFGGPSKGNLYQVPLPFNSAAPHATVARDATNKEKYDDDIEIKSSSKGGKFVGTSDPVENHSRAAAPPERQEGADRHFVLVRSAYERATGNRWNKSDSEAYEEKGLTRVPVEKIISTLEAVARRTPAKINSFRYFIKEIVALPEPCNRAWQKKQLEKVVRRIRDSSVGRAGYSGVDFVDDVKCMCAREGVPFDNDIFNELVS